MTIAVRLPDHILQALRTTGLSTARAAELLGVKHKQAGHLLAKSGAKREHNVLGKWRMGAQ